jgi:hypothetical protein
VEEMTQKRIEDESCSKENWKGKEDPWPREFCLGD